MPTRDEAVQGLNYTIAGQALIRGERSNRAGANDVNRGVANETAFDAINAGLATLPVYNYFAAKSWEEWVAMSAAHSVGLALDGNATEGYTVMATVLDQLQAVIPSGLPAAALVWESTNGAVVVSQSPLPDNHKATLRVSPVATATPFHIRVAITTGAHFSLSLLLQPDGTIVADNS